MSTRRAVVAAASLATLTAAPVVAAPSRSRRVASVTTKDGVRLAVRDWGEGAPVLLLAGWSLASDAWGPLMLRLTAAGRRCIAFDRRGHGRSDDPGAGFDLDTLADDVQTVVEGAGASGLTVVAHSMGATEALRWMRRHGADRVARLVLVAPAGPFLTQTADNPEGVPAEALAAGRRAIAADFPAWIEANTPGFLPSTASPVAVAWLQQQMLRTSLKAAVDCQTAFAGTDLRSDAKAVTRPTLIVHGDRDLSTPLPLTGARYAQMIPGARLQVYEGAPHGLPISHSERLAADILAFAA